MKVFQRLQEHKLFVKKEKCEFAQIEIKFLGHKVNQGQVRMDEKKVQAILEWPAPRNMAKLQSFLGLMNYYRKFVKGYSKRVSPLTNLLRKD